MNERPSVGLALGSGGARGFAHIGVLEVFEEEGIPIDVIAGSSMGAVIGALTALGRSANDLKQLASLFRRKYYIDFTVPKMGLVSGKRLEELFLMLTKGEVLDNLDIPVSVVATDLNSGERFLFTDGSIAKALRASISIPGIFVPVRSGDHLLVDGGVIDRVPANVVTDMGADLVVAVDVSYFPEAPSTSSIYDVIIQSMEIMARELVKAKKIEADILMKPIVQATNAVVFDDTESLIQQGREEALRHMPHIREKIEAWKGKRS
ncbi:patatin-like phospholipase family protein [Salicibibacter cibarius]|uniref:Patatin-like phospholipase family protein n=1 Tax=Salicibibacter cibarius TaxID=2743000 RepID=A0A7T7CCB4_9BACI|nr:patatin-like phospholipase family protein [Salicibibacter cibarius]QQK76745.1 patatin-like phospholipase family protein [Salicibibacter cibarius]